MKIKPIFHAFLFAIIINYAQAQTEPQYKNARVINLGKEFNSPVMDYAPYLSADGTMFFVSDREGSQPTKEGILSHDIWVSFKKPNQDTAFFTPFNPDPPQKNGKIRLNTLLNEGAACISLDKKRLYFTGCNRIDGIGDCDIYVASILYKKDSITIEGVVNIGRGINSEYWDSQPSISPDNRRLYFVSNRPNPEHGKGIDIWYSDLDTLNNEWQHAKPLPKSINTGEIENSPHIAPDNRTLFFASNGHTPNYGKTDFYYSRMSSDGIWSKPINLGKPINTEEAERFICSNITGNTLYFSSTRTDVPGNQGGYDIFAATVPNILEEVNTVSWQQSDDGDAEIIISNGNITIRSFQMGWSTSGRHSFTWDGNDHKINRVPSGKYYYEVKVSGVKDTQGVLLMK
ncbi:MAG: PD40 domain-containing protein [Ignavibacteriae bacterium]|nr:PD40 domain-containing protein [Ignavibacteriota bacterium]